MSDRSHGRVRRYVSAEEFLRTANSPVLNFESQNDFDQIRRALEYEVDPRGFIEEMYVSDIAALVWEILRLRRCKNEVLNREYRSNLYNILEEKCTECSEPSPDNPFTQTKHVDEQKLQRLRNLADDWFTDEKARQKISKLLDGYEIDCAEIEMSLISEPPEQIDALDRAIAALEFRRDKALNCIEAYRHSFAIKIKKSVGSIIDGETVDTPRLENKAAKKSAA